jgi:hypothetical protein
VVIGDVVIWTSGALDIWFSGDREIGRWRWRILVDGRAGWGLSSADRMAPSQERLQLEGLFGLQLRSGECGGCGGGIGGGSAELGAVQADVEVDCEGLRPNVQTGTRAGDVCLVPCHW